jgi:hypothetical protein
MSFIYMFKFIWMLVNLDEGEMPKRLIVWNGGSTVHAIREINYDGIWVN